MTRACDPVEKDQTDTQEPQRIGPIPSMLRYRVRGHRVSQWLAIEIACILLVHLWLVPTTDGRGGAFSGTIMLLTLIARLPYPMKELRRTRTWISHLKSHRTPQTTA
jgi:hypothetical protein